jgi:hypothetical protein
MGSCRLSVAAAAAALLPVPRGQREQRQFKRYYAHGIHPPRLLSAVYSAFIRHSGPFLEPETRTRMPIRTILCFRLSSPEFPILQRPKDEPPHRALSEGRCSGFHWRIASAAGRFLPGFMQPCPQPVTRRFLARRRRSSARGAPGEKKLRMGLCGDGRCGQ